MATQPVLAGTTLAWPQKHTVTRTFRGGTAITADGTQITDLVQASAKRSFSLSWMTMTAAELTDLHTAVDAVKATSGSYTDLSGTVYTVTLDGIGELREESIITASGIRYSVDLKLREA